MKTHYLLSNNYKVIGWVILILGLLTGIVFYKTILDGELLQTNVLVLYNSDSLFDSNNGFFKIIENGILDEIVAILIIVGGLMVGFSKEKIEDEFIFQLRKTSLVWAIIFNYIVLMFAIVLVYNMTFFEVLIFNMFTPLLFFIIRFNFLKYKSRNYDE
ncbi:hypothetical protein DZC78_15750 [Olleya aquimaris]|uniref:Uncharacterized protein n=1 Tax=Olleya sediminilitoris TaxID=2795739 RepID=A0ABS1WLA2_9FLAO|nr:hypothetical protein [Olleya sediminilitoris]AXO81774.1 hypothetical protein DZC78_15750 [Olleya aquimaris]MBL7559895.1 hypothetical protein [Olleya sediminilitoris]